MENSTRLKIKEAIENYCEGINHLEFSVEDFDNILDDIESIFVQANEEAVTNAYNEGAEDQRDEWSQYIG